MYYVLHPHPHGHILIQGWDRSEWSAGRLQYECIIAPTARNLQQGRKVHFLSRREQDFLFSSVSSLHRHLGDVTRRTDNHLSVIRCFRITLSPPSLSCITTPILIHHHDVPFLLFWSPEVSYTFVCCSVKLDQLLNHDAIHFLSLQFSAGITRSLF